MQARAATPTPHHAADVAAKPSPAPVQPPGNPFNNIQSKVQQPKDAAPFKQQVQGTAYEGMPAQKRKQTSVAGQRQEEQQQQQQQLRRAKRQKSVYNEFSTSTEYTSDSECSTPPWNVNKDIIIAQNPAQRLRDAEQQRRQHQPTTHPIRAARASEQVFVPQADSIKGTCCPCDISFGQVLHS